MAGFVQFFQSPQEFSPFEAPVLDQDKKRKPQDKELSVAKKAKKVIINSQPEELNYTPECSQDPLKPLMQTAAQPRPSCQMPMHPPGEMIFPEFWTSAGRTVVPLGEGLWIGKNGRHGEELQLSLSSRIAEEHCNLSWTEDKSRVIVQARNYPTTTLGVCITGGKWVGKEKVFIRVDHLATIKLGEMRIQFRVPQPSENEVIIQSFVVEKGLLLAKKLQTLFNQFDRSLYLGRKPSENNIILGHGTVSRRHGQLQLLEDGSVRVTNLSNNNQLKVNGKGLNTNDSATVPSGKLLMLEIGAVKFFVQVPALQIADDTSALEQNQNTVPDEGYN